MTRPPRQVDPLHTDAKILVALFAGSGILHFVSPKPFEAIVPKALPARRALVYASGAAELACAAGLLAPRTRRLAGAASAALLVAVFPANVQMAVTAKQRLDRDPADTAKRRFLAGTVARLPLQWPLVRAGLRAARGSRRA